jgi:site-specific DNA-methyltransferase (cytosine-N4-specific)
MATVKVPAKSKQDEGYYRIPRPGLLWNATEGELLPADGGRKRPASVKTRRPETATTVRAIQLQLPYPIAAAPESTTD